MRHGYILSIPPITTSVTFEHGDECCIRVFIYRVDASACWHLRIVRRVLTCRSDQLHQTIQVSARVRWCSIWWCTLNRCSVIKHAACMAWSCNKCIDPHIPLSKNVVLSFKFHLIMFFTLPGNTFKFINIALLFLITAMYLSHLLSCESRDSQV